MRMVIPHTTGRLLDELSSDVNAFFESILGEEDSQAKHSFAPRLDFEDRDDSYELAIDLPGMKPEDIHVDVEDDHVAIHGIRHDAQAAAKSDVAGKAPSNRRVERVYGEFRRTVQLPKAVNKDAVVASYEHGVLTVKLPKVAKEGSRRVNVTPGATS
ncbi:MAG: Hsp20/alpha crystallin family protein [Rubripirellula sp.]